jgi:hypothetical protein
VRALLLALTVALSVVAGALAERAPTHSDRAAIRATLGAYLGVPASVRARDTSLVSVRLSTVDGRYAGALLQSKRLGPVRIVLHRNDGMGWFVLADGTSVGCAVAPRPVLDDLQLHCTPPNGVAWISNCGQLVSEPNSITLACGDGNFFVKGLRWRSWGTSGATSTGVAEANDCVPFCAAGHFLMYTVRATATNLRRCGSAIYYARLRLDFLDDRPKGYGKSSTYSLGC